MEKDAPQPASFVSEMTPAFIRQIKRVTPPVRLLLREPLQNTPFDIILESELVHAFRVESDLFNAMITDDTGHPLPVMNDAVQVPDAMDVDGLSVIDMDWRDSDAVVGTAAAPGLYFTGTAVGGLKKWLRMSSAHKQKAATLLVDYGSVWAPIEDTYKSMHGRLALLLLLEFAEHWGLMLMRQSLLHYHARAYVQHPAWFIYQIPALVKTGETAGSSGDGGAARGTKRALDTPSDAPPAKQPRTDSMLLFGCHICGTPATGACSECEAEFYCSTACQAVAARTHTCLGLHVDSDARGGIGAAARVDVLENALKAFFRQADTEPRLRIDTGLMWPILVAAGSGVAENLKKFSTAFVRVFRASHDDVTASGNIPTIPSTSPQDIFYPYRGIQPFLHGPGLPPGLRQQLLVEQQPYPAVSVEALTLATIERLAVQMGIASPSRFMTRFLHTLRASDLTTDEAPPSERDFLDVRTEFHRAARGSHPMVALSASGADLMRFSAATGDVEVAKVLLKLPSERFSVVQARNFWGRSPIMEAIAYGRTEIFKMLVEKQNIDIDKHNNNNHEKWLHAAILAQSVDIMEILLKSAQRFDRDLMQRAIWIQINPRRGVYPDLPVLPSHAFIRAILADGRFSFVADRLNGMEPLGAILQAASMGDDELVLLYIEDVHVRDSLVAGIEPFIALITALDAGSSGRGPSPAVVERVLTDERIPIDAKSRKAYRTVAKFPNAEVLTALLKKVAVARRHL